jgi:hypothetical protein
MKVTAISKRKMRSNIKSTNKIKREELNLPINSSLTMWLSFCCVSLLSGMIGCEQQKYPKTDAVYFSDAWTEYNPKYIHSD